MARGVFLPPHRCHSQGDTESVTLSLMFQKLSSKACLFLSAINANQNGTGTIRWQNPQRALNQALTFNETHTTVHIKGFYLLFVQATFKMKCSKNVSSCSDLMLRVNHHYRESSRYFSAVYNTYCTAANCDENSSRKDVDMVLSQPTLLWMEPQDSLSVSVSNMEWVDYEQTPTSTFLTLLKYSD
ncbi:hypothetical protein GN956_G19769 [Arapaima gigas]